MHVVKGWLNKNYIHYISDKMKVLMEGTHSAHNDATHELDFSVKPKVMLKNSVVNFDVGYSLFFPDHTGTTCHTHLV